MTCLSKLLSHIHCTVPNSTVHLVDLNRIALKRFSEEGCLCSSRPPVRSVRWASIPY